MMTMALKVVEYVVEFGCCFDLENAILLGREFGPVIGEILSKVFQIYLIFQKQV